ncbi:MAG: PAS domain S-box protein, partial [Spirochaetales bacterium]|nr:PAS domain S-box protein [Spirochaetales bacterium]
MNTELKKNIGSSLLQEGSLFSEDSVFKAVFYNNNAIMLLVDPENMQHILAVNESAVKFYGYSKEEFCKLTMGDINVLSDPERKSLMQKALVIPGSYFQFKHKTALEEVKTVEVHASPIVLNRKKVMFIIVHDITPLKKTKSILTANENKYRSFFESSPLSLWEQDFSELILYLEKLRIRVGEDIRKYLDNNPDTIRQCSHLITTLDVNEASVVLYEAKSKGELLLNFEYIDTEKSFKMFKEKIISLYNGQRHLSAETEQLTLKGHKINIKLEMVLITESKALITITDLTEQKKKEAELEELLVQTRSDAETKEILLREINHRVKNNLSSFIGMLYAEKRQAGHEMTDAQLDLVEGMINRVKGVAIAHELLSVSNWTPVSLFTLTDKIIHSISYLIPSDRSVEVKITPSSILLNADQSHSMAVIVNE